MIIEMLPHLGRKELNAGIERGRRCHDEGQQRGVKRVDVAEVDDRRASALQLSEQVDNADERDNNQKDQRVDI